MTDSPAVADMENPGGSADSGATLRPPLLPQCGSADGLSVPPLLLPLPLMLLLLLDGAPRVGWLPTDWSTTGCRCRDGARSLGGGNTAELAMVTGWSLPLLRLAARHTRAQ